MRLYSSSVISVSYSAQIHFAMGNQLIYVKYQVKDQDLFDKAFGYIRQY
jgi:hypothetical protein